MRKRRSEKGSGESPATDSALWYSIASADAVEFLASLGAESLDLMITDPPYESLEKHRSVGTTTRLKQSKASSNQWFSVFPNQRFEELFEQVYRVNDELLEIMARLNVKRRSHGE